MAALPAEYKRDLRRLDHVTEQDVQLACHRLWGTGDRWSPPRRVAAMICTIAFTRLTLEETLTLTLDDVPTLLLPPLGWDALDRWLTHRRRWTCHWLPEAPLFCTLKNGKPRNRRVVLDEVVRAFRWLGVLVTPRTLKWSEASHGLKACPETLRRRLEPRSLSQSV